MDRSPDATATFNGIDNVHRDWNVSACANLDIAIGLEGYYYRHQGDGATTIINTDIVWPEQFNSSVVVLEENNNRIFTQMVLTTDYTVSYDGSDKLIITLTIAADSNSRIHIWPAQPRTDLNRRPYSNNLWENIRCSYVFVRGHQAIRWVDAETYRFERLLANANFVRLHITNPFTDRTGQGGDYLRFDDSIWGYQSTVTDETSLLGIDMGPGSNSMIGTGMRYDLSWTTPFESDDKATVSATGTVTVNNGSAAVVGLGTSFTDEFTLIGASPDIIVIDGIRKGIASINSDTSITLAVASTVTDSGLSIERYNVQNGNSYDFQFAAIGSGFTTAQIEQVARFFEGSLTEQSGTATILNGGTSVTVTNTLYRAPDIGEIQVTPHSITDGRTWSISDITNTSFRINLNSAAGADYNFGWAIKLTSL
jgi:hypothetical protein